jgi:hypothetical protein
LFRADTIHRVAILERPPPSVDSGFHSASAPVWFGLRRSVLMSWMISRALGIITLMVLGARSARFIPDYSRLVMWDGNWYRIIATTGYGRAPLPDQWSTWPFFPLLPAISWLAHVVGSPYTAALLVCSNLAALVALAGVHRLGRAYGERAANWAVWLTALFPGSITFVMAYPDSVYLAGAVWAFALVASNRPALAGVAAVVATAARPNGILLLLPLAVAALHCPATRRIVRLGLVLGPSLVFIGGWCTWQWHAAGSPLAFVETKGAWEESTLLDVLKAPLAERYGLLHVALAALLAMPFLVGWRRYPLAWRVLVVFSLVPPIGFGVVGMARYSICCFPLAIAAGDAAARRSPRRLPRWPLMASAALTVWFGLLISYCNYVP